MRIIKQTAKPNQFNIENLTLGRVLSIINALDYCEKKGLNTRAGSLLTTALNNQLHKLKKQSPS